LKEAFFRVRTSAAYVKLTHSIIRVPHSDALAENQGGCIYFDSSLHPAQFNSSSTKFYQAVASSGAAIAIVGKHSQNWTNYFAANEFSGLAASIDGGSFLLLNASAQISLSDFSNNFAVSGASCIDAISSTVKLSSNTYNFTGRPQNYARLSSAVTDDNSMFVKIFHYISYK
jgi:hypothetical protein